MVRITLRRTLIFLIVATLCIIAVGCGKKASQEESELPQKKPAETAMSAPLPKIDESKLKTTKSGLKYMDVKVGTGITPKKGDLVVVEYTGWLTNGKVFDTSRGRQPFMFNLYSGEVIKCWDEAISTMKAGGRRIIISPPSLAYGEDGNPGGAVPIPPNTTLIFDIELLDVITGE